MTYAIAGICLFMAGMLIGGSTVKPSVGPKDKQFMVLLGAALMLTGIAAFAFAEITA